MPTQSTAGPTDPFKGAAVFVVLEVSRVRWIRDSLMLTFPEEAIKWWQAA